MKKINDRLVSWASILDSNAEAQAITTATMPFIYPHLDLGGCLQPQDCGDGRAACGGAH